MFCRQRETLADRPTDQLPGNGTIISSANRSSPTANTPPINALASSDEIPTGSNRACQTTRDDLSSISSTRITASKSRMGIGPLAVTR